jgi:hypothetical protein
MHLFSHAGETINIASITWQYNNVYVMLDIAFVPVVYFLHEHAASLYLEKTNNPQD